VISILIAAGVALAIALLGTPVAIHAFSVWGWGQRIREDGPHTHLEKMGTPTMGGIVILLAFIGGYVASRITAQRVTATGLVLVLAAVGFGIVGFLDDYAKVMRQRSLGLTKTQKFIGTAIVSLAFAWVVMRYGEAAGITTHVSFVRPTAIALGALFVVWAFFVLTGSSNAVNLTDGLDGLAAGCAAIVLLAYIAITFTTRQFDLALVAACLVGGCVGFLWFNSFPASIFMGDTGSLGLGGAIAGLAVMTKTEVLLIILGGIFVIEALSVLIQVASFQAFRKRVFLMAPIHHHFELRAWSETKIILRFWIVAAVCSAIGFTLYQQSLT
jgi:phospho-N-acetylmuramoyl-pentapeptide-transferase